jgi:membrane protein implicated in regulation of membrane protease activity
MRSDEQRDKAWARFRRIALVAIGLWCAGFGVAMIGVLITTDTLGSTNTAALSMIVGVILLPALTLVMIHLDRRVLKRVTAEQECTLDRAVVAHTRHDRSSKHTAHTNRIAQNDSVSRVA